MLVHIRIGTNMAAGNQQKQLSHEELKSIKIILFSNTRTVQIAKLAQIPRNRSLFLTNMTSLSAVM